MNIADVTADDIRLALVPVSKKSASVYKSVNILYKSIFAAAKESKVIQDNPTIYLSGKNGGVPQKEKTPLTDSAEESKIISYNPAASLSAKGGTPKQEKKALTDEQVKILLDTIRGLPPYVFVMIGLYAGLRREEILALRWDCVFLDGATPYISVRRAWRSVNNRPVISTELKTPAAKRDIPIPGKLVECLKEAKEKSKSEYVISDRNGNALAESQFVRVWKYIAVRSTEERCYYTYVNGQKIKHVVKPKLGEHQPNNPKLVYTMDFQVTPHQLRHTYITNLIYASVDPKTVQYLAGHENSKVTMDIYAKVKYNKPAQLHGVINRAIDTSKKD